MLILARQVLYLPYISQLSNLLFKRITRLSLTSFAASSSSESLHQFTAPEIRPRQLMHMITHAAFLPLATHNLLAVARSLPDTAALANEVSLDNYTMGRLI